MKKIIIGIFLALSVVSFANNDVRSVARLLGTSDGRVINVVDGDKIRLFLLCGWWNSGYNI